jgi:hypothetical protein
VRGNNPALGGAIWSFGHTEVFNSTISGNAADPGDGNETRGGGLYVIGSSSISHATITGNSAEEGAGLYDTDGDSSISGSIVGGNIGPECWQETMETVDEHHNVSDDTSCEFAAEGDRQGVDARLASLADNGGPTDTHALLGGSPAIDGQAAEFCPSVDQRYFARAAGSCDIGAFEAGFTPPPGDGGGGGGGSQQPPPPPQDDQQELPPPQAGKTVNALPAQGTVKIRLPGGERFVELDEGQQVPVGTVFDTLKGRVTLVAAGGQEATFYGGVFKIGQGSGAKPLTTLKLVEKLSCAKRGKASAAARKKKKRRLWGDGKGRFRTEGEFSSATVRGTKWLVEDRCTSTLTRVVKGSVSVRDKVKRKTVIVRAGKKYVAKSKR